MTETPQEGKDRLQALVDSSHNGHRKRTRAIVYGGLVAIGVLVTLVGGLVLNKLDVTISATQRNAEVTKAIQTERARATRLGCQEQNLRNVRLVRTLAPLIARSTTSPEERARGREFTVLLADSIAPKRDCAKVVRISVGRDDDR